MSKQSEGQIFIFLFIILFYILNFILHVCANTRMCHGMCVDVRGQLTVISSLVSPRWFGGLNLDHLVAVTLHSEPSHLSSF